MSVVSDKGDVLRRVLELALKELDEGWDRNDMGELHHFKITFELTDASGKTLVICPEARVMG